MRNQEWLLEELRREHRCQSAPPACEAAALNVLPSSHAQHHANVYEVITLWRTCVTAVVTQQVVRALGLVRAAVCLRGIQTSRLRGIQTCSPHTERPSLVAQQA